MDSFEQKNCQTRLSAMKKCLEKGFLDEAEVARQIRDLAVIHGQRFLDVIDSALQNKENERITAILVEVRKEMIEKRVVANTP